MAIPVRGWEQTDLDPFCEKVGKGVPDGKEDYLMCPLFGVHQMQSWCTPTVKEVSKVWLHIFNVFEAPLPFFCGPWGVSWKMSDLYYSGFLNCAISWFQNLPDFLFWYHGSKTTSFLMFLDVSRLAFFYGNFLGKMMWGIWQLCLWDSLSSIPQRQMGWPGHI
jgi:hypothetical protein